jgi:hypothetical protein
MITQDQVIADIEAALDLLPPIEDGDIPLSTFAAHWRISQNGAKARLIKAQELGEGRLVMVQLKPGARGYVWRPAR